MCQRRPADPTDPGDAADLSIMGYRIDGCDLFLAPLASVVALHLCAEQQRNQ